jgi:hypothetical protein
MNLPNILGYYTGTPRFRDPAVKDGESRFGVCIPGERVRKYATLYSYPTAKDAARALRFALSRDVKNDLADKPHSPYLHFHELLNLPLHLRYRAQLRFQLPGKVRRWKQPLVRFWAASSATKAAYKGALFELCVLEGADMPRPQTLPSTTEPGPTVVHVPCYVARVLLAIVVEITGDGAWLPE